MDLTLTPKEQAFQTEVRAWLEAHAPKDWRRSTAQLDQRARFEFLRHWQRQAYHAGWVGIAWPTEYGGRGATLIEQVIFLEEMARVRAPPFANGLGLGIIGPTIINFGTEDQKKQHIKPILSADKIWCQGFSEPNAGSDLAALGTEAHLEGDHYIVNGQKIWNSYGWAADWCALLVRTDPASEKHNGLSLLVDMQSTGVEVRPLRQMTGESEFSELFFTNVRVPVANLLGKPGEGWRVAVGTLMHERNTLGASITVAYRQALDRLVEITRTLERNGRPACEDPLVRQRIGQACAEVEVFRLIQMRAISRVSNTGIPGPEGSILKLFWSEYNQRFQQWAQEILGPHGQLVHGCDLAIDDGAWAHGFLRARGNTIEAGTSEIQRNIIGRFVLGLPKSY